MVMAYCYWTGLGPVSMNGLGMTEGVTFNTRIGSQTLLVPWGESAAKCHSASGANFKKILRVDQVTKDFGQRWGLHGKRWKGNYLGPH